MLKKIGNRIKTIIFLKSLRLRIFVIVLLAGIIPAVCMRYGIMNNYEKQAVEQRISTVQNQLMVLSNHLIGNNYLTNYKSNEQSVQTSKEVINAELDMLSSLYEGRVMIINRNFKVIKDTYGISEGKTIISEEVLRCFLGQTSSHYDKEHGYIEIATPIVSTTQNGSDSKATGNKAVSGEVVGVMLTSVTNENIAATLDSLSRKAGILELLLIVIIMSLAIILSGALTRPFNKITAAIKEVKEGYSDKEISAPDYIETVHMVDAFNQLQRRMKILDDSRQEFVANVSHELKTPMASVKVLADSLLTQENVPAELYREFMEDIVSEIDRENQIITDLLALVKMDKKAQDLNIVSLDINNLTELILKRLRPLARKKDVELVFESMRPVFAEVDEVKISLVMTNLVENAIKYNKELGWVKVTLDADHQYFSFRVSDSGIGIPEEELGHIYERFYRVDKSHSREIGGTGLGLAITRSAVLAHKGSISVESTEGSGSCFTVRIPLTYIA